MIFDEPDPQARQFLHSVCLLMDVYQGEAHFTPKSRFNAQIPSTIRTMRSLCAPTIQAGGSSASHPWAVGAIRCGIGVQGAQDREEATAICTSWTIRGRCYEWQALATTCGMSQQVRKHPSGSRREVFYPPPSTTLPPCLSSYRSRLSIGRKWASEVNAIGKCMPKYGKTQCSLRRRSLS
ncbi:hypothetical protein BDW22DRAFT_1222359 [Trametopsis cervina]|nr:hypothetical protein BDW22DRAFT_1222359 [Trametopsis cervina]